MKKVFFLFVIFAAATFTLSAQKVVISGTQTAGTAGSNARLSSDAVTITEIMSVGSIDCDCAGFWIATEDKIIKKFPDAGAAVGYVLKPGTYMVYPNLRQGQTTAKVEVRLVPGAGK
jgi:hypothetical protein